MYIYMIKIGSLDPKIFLWKTLMSVCLRLYHTEPEIFLSSSMTLIHSAYQSQKLARLVYTKNNLIFKVRYFKNFIFSGNFANIKSSFTLTQTFLLVHERFHVRHPHKTFSDFHYLSPI